ncbi:uncharacterized protein METZ01_LOCUS439384, partial [marine metagenome]
GSLCANYYYQGEGETRQENGSYPAKFMLDYSDLSPHTTYTCSESGGYYIYETCSAGWNGTSECGEGETCDVLNDDNAQEAKERCWVLCEGYDDWCLASEILTRDVWPTPNCQLITDYETFTNAGMSFVGSGSSQEIDGVTYQTYCGGNDCESTDMGTYPYGFNPSSGYHSYLATWIFCNDDSACNTGEEGDCLYEDCAGECGGTAEEDCAGECGGTAEEDCAGECGGTAVADCAGECNGDAVVDCSGECGGTAEDLGCGCG